MYKERWTDRIIFKVLERRKIIRIKKYFNLLRAYIEQPNLLFGSITLRIASSDSIYLIFGNRCV